MHPYSSLQSRVSVSKTEGAVPGGGKNSTMDKRIEINGKCLQIVEMDLAVVLPFLFPENGSLFTIPVSLPRA